MDSKAFFKLSYGLYIVTSKNDNQESGCVINTMTQVTAEPSQVCITLNKENYTTQIIEKSGVFNVSVLLEKVPMETIRTFGFQCGKDVNKFENIAYETDVNDVKYLTENTAAMFACRVKKTVDVGTHLMFISEVEDAQTLSDETVLTYAAYHDKKNGTTHLRVHHHMLKKQRSKVGVVMFVDLFMRAKLYQKIIFAQYVRLMQVIFIKFKKRAVKHTL